MITEIDAINRMLRYIGELPIPSAVTIDQLPEGHEAVYARTVLEETLREEQEEKWWFNTFDIKLVPDSQGYLLLPNNVVGYEDPDVFQEGGLLYDRSSQSPIFSGPKEMTVRYNITFDNLPDVFRTYVILTAARYLHTYLNGDESTQRELEQKINTARIKVEREHLKQKKFNLVRGNRLIDRGTNPTAVI